MRRTAVRTRMAALAGVVVVLGAVASVAVLVRHPGAARATALAHTRQPSAGLATGSPSATATPSPEPTTTQTPAAIATPARTPTPSTRPTASGSQYVAYFTTLPPGSALPSDAQCAREIAGNPWEPRPQNQTANHANVYAQGFRLTNSYLAPYGSGYQNRVTGNFSGTTDQILRWGACKWGFDENTVRAQAVQESWWRQSTLGDCNSGATQPGTNGCASVGILQVKAADIPATHPGTWPAAWSSTAFNVDYTLAVRRLCYEGKETWLRSTNPAYAAGDLWGCIGRWFSGRWYDPGASTYIQKVKAITAAKTWTTF